jgi:predicted aspartyl protease
MGEVRIRLDLENTADVQKRAAVEAIVDTGAMINWLPQRVVEALGLQAMGTLEVRFADGGIEGRTVYGPITLRIDGRFAVTDAVAGSDDTEALLGVVTLERLDLLVDPVDQKVKPRHPDRPGPVLGVRCASRGPRSDTVSTTKRTKSPTRKQVPPTQSENASRAKAPRREETQQGNEVHQVPEPRS